jgi:hypothetical protein
MGANLLQVSRWLSTVQITADVYGHLFPETNDLVIGRLDKARRAALPHPTDTPSATNDPAGSPRVTGLDLARNRHGAPSAARFAWEDDAATMTCAGSGSPIGSAMSDGGRRAPRGVTVRFG